MKCIHSFVLMGSLIAPLLAFSPVRADTITTITGDVTAFDSTQVGRLLRNGMASVAGTLKPFPGVLDLQSIFHLELALRPGIASRASM